VFAALKDIRASLPFPLLGIDSYNGSEFINDELHRYCKEEGLAFTRSRPYRKNDGGRVGHDPQATPGRFDTPEELKVLNRIHVLLHLHTNFFMPGAKLISKTREGSKVKKHCDAPRSPYHRVLENEHVSDEVKASSLEYIDSEATNRPLEYLLF